MALSIVSVRHRKSYPLGIKQIVKEPQIEEKVQENAQRKAQEKASKPEQPSKEKKPKGRKKGSKNKPKEASKDIQYKVLETLLQTVTLSLISTLGCLPSSYLLLDGYFGNQYYVRLARQFNVHLISKLRCTSGLYFPYTGLYSGKGRKNKYGKN